MMPKYSDKVKGEYPSVLTEEIGVAVVVVVVLEFSGLDVESEEDVDVVVVGTRADTSPTGVPCGIVLPGSKKMNWWMESSWLNPSSRLVRMVTAPV